MLRRALLGLVGAVACSPALAFNYCHEAWFTKNLIFDRAGYCFGSVLGQNIFNNSDCTTKSPVLSPADTQIVSELRAEEQRIGCRVDTGSTGPLDIPNIRYRRLLSPLPVPDTLGFGCMGWRGDAVPLFSSAGLAGQAVTTLQPGDNVLVYHFGTPYADFLTVDRNSQTIQGWGAAPLNAQTCTQIAG